MKIVQIRWLVEKIQGKFQAVLGRIKPGASHFVSKMAAQIGASQLNKGKIYCRLCGETFDAPDLSQVLLHQHDNWGVGLAVEAHGVIGVEVTDEESKGEINHVR